MGLYRRFLGGGVGSISPAEAYQRLQAMPEVVIVDVRQPLEPRSGTVPGAVLIPLSEFGRRLAELPRDRPILTVCRSGHRSRGYRSSPRSDDTALTRACVPRRSTRGGQPWRRCRTQ